MSSSLITTLRENLEKEIPVYDYSLFKKIIKDSMESDPTGDSLVAILKQEVYPYLDVIETMLILEAAVDDTERMEPEDNTDDGGDESFPTLTYRDGLTSTIGTSWIEPGFKWRSERNGRLNNLFNKYVYGESLVGYVRPSQARGIDNLYKSFFHGSRKFDKSVTPPLEFFIKPPAFSDEFVSKWNKREEILEIIHYEIDNPTSSLCDIDHDEDEDDNCYYGCTMSRMEKVECFLGYEDITIDTTFDSKDIAVDMGLIPGTPNYTYRHAYDDLLIFENLHKKSGYFSFENCLKRLMKEEDLGTRLGKLTCYSFVNRFMGGRETLMIGNLLR